MSERTQATAAYNGGMIERRVRGATLTSNTNTLTSGRALPLWALPTALSLDAPLVAVLWQGLFATSFGVSLVWYHPVILGLSVWLVYVADRLLDAGKLDLSQPHTFRHVLHAKHRRVFAAAWMLAFGTVGVLALRLLNPREILLGTGVAAAVLAYAAGIHLTNKKRPVFTKELQVGLVFGAGVTLSVWAQAPSLQLLFSSLLFAALCSLNCLLIAVWEQRVDRAQHQPSLALTLPHLPSLLPPILILFSSGTLALTLLLPHPLTLSLSLAAVLLWLLNCYQHAFSRESLRVLADVALLTPLLSLVF